MDTLSQLHEGVDASSPEETWRWAAVIASLLPPDTALALHGGLGTGKTTFVQGLARAWGIHRPVTSPTFAIYSLYRGSRMLLHVDAYRLDSPGEGDDLMIDDLLESPWCAAVEWPQKLDAWWMQDAWHLSLRVTGDQSRHLRLSTA